MSLVPLLPNQRCTTAEKKTKSFYQATYDNLIARAIALNNKTEVQEWLNAANGIISNQSIEYLTSPIKDNVGKAVGKMPGEIRSTDLINTLRERNLGEYIGLPYKYEVSVHNEDVVLKRNTKVKQEVDKLVQQVVINELNKLAEERAQAGDDSSIQTGEPSIDVPKIEELIKTTITNYIDDRAIQGQDLLDLVNDLNNFDSKRLQAFFYWWACEEFYTYREIINGEVKTYTISPLEGFPIIGDTEFAEDGDAFIIKRKITFTEFKNRYSKKLSQEEFKYINNLVKSKNGYTVTNEFLRARALLGAEKQLYSGSTKVDNVIVNSDELIDDYTIIWRTETPITIKTYVDVLGNEQQEIVEEGYVAMPGEIISNEWIDEVWIGKRFGDQTKGFYLEPDACPVQRYDVATNRAKLPVGGRKGILKDILQNPIPKRLISYELIDRIFTLQIERTVAKFKTHLTVLPQSMINDDATGTSAEKTFYMKADDLLVYDDTQVDLQTAIQGLRSINLNTSADYLKVLMELKKHYKQEGLEMANMNNFRLGDIAPSTGKGVVQEGIYRASVGSVLSITSFNAALERDHTADLEFAKIAYIQGKKTSFFSRSKQRTVYLDINPFDLLNTDYGVFVHNAKTDDAKIQAYKQYAFNASQNGQFRLGAAAIDADTLPEVRRAVDDILDAQEKFQERLAQEQNAASVQAEQIKAQNDEREREVKIQIAQSHDQAIVYAAAITASSKTDGTTSTAAPTFEVNNLMDNYYKEQELNIKRDSNNIKREQIQASKEIAKENKNKFDKK